VLWAGHISQALGYIIGLDAASPSQKEFGSSYFMYRHHNFASCYMKCR
jgi:hypothetical protein